MVVCLYQLQLRKAFPSYYGNVLSDCVCKENAKCPEDLFEEPIHRVPLRQYLSHT